MQRLTPAMVAPFRARLGAEQKGLCAICRRPLGDKTKAPVLDHDHLTGEIRGVLHRGCNSLLGHIENGKARYGLTAVSDLARFLAGVQEYMHAPGHGVLHPTYRTEDEKRERTNARRRKARAAAKEKT